MEAYIEAKKNIAKNQTEKDTCVLNYEDDVTRAFGENIKSKVLYFSSQRILEEGIYLDGEKIVLSLNGEKTEICTVNELNILGNMDMFKSVDINVYKADKKSGNYTYIGKYSDLDGD